MWCFFTVDLGFDSEDLCAVCVTEKIEANIKLNPRNKVKMLLNINVLTKYCINEEL